MAIDKEFLARIGIPADLHDDIIKSHEESVNALTLERDEAKREVEELHTIRDELESLTEYKDKYIESVRELETVKKECAYRQMLKKAGMRQAYIDRVVRADAEVIAGIRLVGENIAGEDILVSDARRNWGAFMHGDVSPEAGADNTAGKSAARSALDCFRDTVDALLK
jgi:hypothetical protein